MLHLLPSISCPAKLIVGALAEKTHIFAAHAAFILAASTPTASELRQQVLCNKGISISLLSFLSCLEVTAKGGGEKLQAIKEIQKKH